jgi:hypothetical protein
MPILKEIFHFLAMIMISCIFMIASYPYITYDIIAMTLLMPSNERKPVLFQSPYLTDKKDSCQQCAWKKVEPFLAPAFFTNV